MVRGALSGRETTVEVLLDDSPAYDGSAHDNATARRMGYKAALIPGAFVYGHATRLAVDAWGMDWISRGSMAPGSAGRSMTATD